MWELNISNIKSQAYRSNGKAFLFKALLITFLIICIAFDAFLYNRCGAIFFIINKAYKHAKLAQWGTGDRDIGIDEQKVHPDQLWTLEAEPEHPGYYYICNVQNNEYRIGKWGGDDQAVSNYNGQYLGDQLWKFEKYGDFYRIFN